MLYYRNQPPIVAFDGITLTDTFADNQFEFDCGGFSRLSVNLGYTVGDAETANTLDMLLEASPDEGENWYSLVIDETATVSEISQRVWQVASTSKLNIIVDIAYTKMRVSVKETGVETNPGTATVILQLSGL